MSNGVLRDIKSFYMTDSARAPPANTREAVTATFRKTLANFKKAVPMSSQSLLWLKCLKAVPSPGLPWNYDLVKRQLRAGGVVHAVEAYQGGLSDRMSIKDFANR